MAKGFIDRKLEQYLDILEKIVQAKSNYVNEKIAKLD